MREQTMHDDEVMKQAIECSTTLLAMTHDEANEALTTHCCIDTETDMIEYLSLVVAKHCSDNVKLAAIRYIARERR